MPRPRPIRGPSRPFFGSSGISRTRAGWTVGGGLEYAVTNNWSVRAEYRYSDFGRYTDFPFAGVPIAPAVFQATSGHHLTENQVQVGISYKFDTWLPAPLVANIKPEIHRLDVNGAAHIANASDPSIPVAQPVGAGVVSLIDFQSSSQAQGEA